MSGRRLLDLAAVISASRGVSEKHIALRARQLDVYNRSSTLVTSIRAQTDRVTETARAASLLAARLNEAGPEWAAGEDRDGKSHKSQSVVQIPHRSTIQGSRGRITKVGLEQDHFYNTSIEHSAADASSELDLQIKQEKADRYPLPDGTILPSSAPIDKSNTGDSHAVRVQCSQWDGLFPNDVHEPCRAAAIQGPSTPDHQEPNTQTMSAAASSFTSARSCQTSNSMDASMLEHIPDDDINIGVFSNSHVAQQPRASSSASVSHPTREDMGEISSENLLAFNTGSQGVPGAYSTVTPADKLPKTTKAPADTISEDQSIENLAVPSGVTQDGHVTDVKLQPSYELRESQVPSSRFGRLWNYGGLAAGMFGGAISESLRRFSGGGGEGSYMLSAANMDRLVTKLSRMRGAALKLGQMISFQDSKMLPLAIQEVLQRVQDRADYMPPAQRDKVLVSNLGSGWRDLFSEFEEKPIAAASIGQVHKAVLKSNGVRVAVKIQYPGVADSIDSDLDNLTLLLTASRLLPKGLFLDKTIENARTELAWECDYIREAECVRKFQRFLVDEKQVFAIPQVFQEASGKQVLTMEFMDGVAVTRIHSFSQAQKDWIGTQILRLSLREITEFKFMQTDPNWTNFLFNHSSNKLELLDFGASREYPSNFISQYSNLLAAASRSDAESVRELSIELGYLTGHESKAMLDAHLASVMTLAEPFLASSPEVYDFKNQTITERVKALIPVMIRERLSPPPEETYSLHRKLSGAFLLCAKLGSRVRCRELFDTSMRKAGVL